MEYKEHHSYEYGDTPNSACQNLIYFIRTRELFLAFGFGYRAGKLFRYVAVARVRDKRFKVVSEKLACVPFFKLSHLFGCFFMRLYFQLVTFNKFYGVKERIAYIAFGKQFCGFFRNRRQFAFFKHGIRLSFRPRRRFRRLHKLVYVLAFKRAYLHNGNVQLARKQLRVHLVPHSLHFVHHIERYDHGYVRFQYLRGEI